MVGLKWMVSLYNNHLNGILADEMVGVQGVPGGRGGDEARVLLDVTPLLVRMCACRHTTTHTHANKASTWKHTCHACRHAVLTNPSCPPSSPPSPQGLGKTVQVGALRGSRGMPWAREQLQLCCARCSHP